MRFSLCLATAAAGLGLLLLAPPSASAGCFLCVTFKSTFCTAQGCLLAKECRSGLVGFDDCRDDCGNPWGCDNYCATVGSHCGVASLDPGALSPSEYVEDGATASVTSRPKTPDERSAENARAQDTLATLPRHRRPV